jgi:ADP-heptose:LPS heptosyltransferase
VVRSQLANGELYFVAYLSQGVFYDRPEVSGYNRSDHTCPGRWTLEDWCDTIALLDQHLERRYRCVLVGASYDASCASETVARLRRKHPHLVEPVNLTGSCSVLETIEVLRRAALVVGYPSGIPILATYLRRPTVMFYNYNPVSRVRRPDGHGVIELMHAPGFAVSWVPPDCLGTSYEYLRFGLHRPADVLEKVKRFQKRCLM